MRDKKTALLAGIVMAGLGCAPPQKPEPYVPAMRYSVPNSTAQSRGLQWEGALVQDSTPDGRAQMKFVDVPPAPQAPQVPNAPSAPSAPSMPSAPSAPSVPSVPGLGALPGASTGRLA